MAHALAHTGPEQYLPWNGDDESHLDLQHHLWLQLMDGALAWAPIEEPGRVLDIGTGTGTWAKQFARQNPRSAVVGADVDLSNILPPGASGPTPANCTFAQEDAETDDWIYDDVEPYDYVHLRLMSTCLASPRALVSRLFARLAPGGWLEYQDFAFEVIGENEVADARVSTSGMAAWCDLAVRGYAGLYGGRDVRVARRYKGWLREAGFVDVQERQILAPANAWPLHPLDRQRGRSMERELLGGIEEAAMRIWPGAGLGEEDIRGMLPVVCEDILDRRLRAYYPMYVVYGRKPLDA